ncbi:hypothetical protein D3C86_1263080 [compost metagenome]
MQLRRITYGGLLIEVTGAAEGFQISPALRGLVLVVNREGEFFHIQGNAVAEDHHHENRPEQGEGHAHFIAQQLLAFTTRQCPQSSKTEAVIFHRCDRYERRVDGRWRRRRCDRALGLFQTGDERRLQCLALELLLQGCRGVAGQYLAGVHQ